MLRQATTPFATLAEHRAGRSVGIDEIDAFVDADGVPERESVRTDDHRATSGMDAEAP